MKIPHFLAESSHNLAFWHAKADGAGHSDLEGIGVVVWPAGHFARPDPILTLRKRSGLSRDCGDTHEPFPERDEMDDEVFVFFFSSDGSLILRSATAITLYCIE